MNMLEFLTAGLLAGYLSKGLGRKNLRGGFPFNSVHLETPNSAYHDEWIAKRTGGGQEIAQVDEAMFTRLYAGGVANSETLYKLGITEKDVIKFLKTKLIELGGKTRLFEKCSTRDGDWLYTYEIIEQFKENIPVHCAEEVIFYKDKIVFVHLFLLCPIE